MGFSRAPLPPRHTYTFLACFVLRQMCSTCNRDRIPPWLLDVHGRTILPGSIVTCPSGSAQYIVQPPPPASLSRLPNNCLGASTSSRSNRRPTTPPTAQKLASTSPRTPGARVAASSRTPPVSPGRIAGVVGRMRVSAKNSSPPSPLPSARSDARTEASYRRDVEGLSPENSRSPRRTKGAPIRSLSPHANKIGSTSNGSGNTLAVGVNHRQKREREETVLENENATMKAKFEAQSGATHAVMVTAVHGVRPQTPRAGRSLEGYCVVVSSRTSS